MTNKQILLRAMNDFINWGLDDFLAGRTDLEKESLLGEVLDVKRQLTFLDKINLNDPAKSS